MKRLKQLALIHPFATYIDKPSNKSSLEESVAYSGGGVSKGGITHRRGHRSSECRNKDSSAAAKRVQDEEETKKFEEAKAKKAARNRKKNEK